MLKAGSVWEASLNQGFVKLFQPQNSLGTDLGHPSQGQNRNAGAGGKKRQGVQLDSQESFRLSEIPNESSAGRSRGGGRQLPSKNDAARKKNCTDGLRTAMLQANNTCNLGVPNNDVRDRGEGKQEAINGDNPVPHHLCNQTKRERNKWPQEKKLSEKKQSTEIPVNGGRRLGPLVVKGTKPKGAVKRASRGENAPKTARAGTEEEPTELKKKQTPKTWKGRVSHWGENRQKRWSLGVANSVRQCLGTKYQKKKTEKSLGGDRLKHRG